eukprot:TCONS_00024238-protein
MEVNLKLLSFLALCIGLVSAIRFRPMRPGEPLEYFSMPNYIQNDTELLIKRDELRPFSMDSFTFGNFGNATRQSGVKEENSMKRSDWSKYQVDYVLSDLTGRTLGGFTNNMFTGDQFTLTSKIGVWSSINSTTMEFIMAMELKEMNSEVIFCSHLKMKSVKLEIQYKGQKKQGELIKSLQGELKSFKLDGSVQIKGVWRK